MLEELAPVGDGAHHAAAVDEVEGLVGAVGPVAFDVVDVKFEVRRDPGWLDGAEICADYFGFGVFVGEVDGPDALD